MVSLIGQSLGRYHILEQLGEGGMATVYKAYDTRLERDVAIKVIRIDQFAPTVLERILKRFEREAKALARLTHPNIVHINDYGEQDGIPYLVMDYLPGGTLKQRLGKPILWQEAIRLLIPVAEALEYAHEHGIIHRDVKPSNILLTEKGQPMLTDFGIAKILESEETAELTGTGMGVGTPEYMAPEQSSSKSVDQRADIYSLGIVLYEMVTGRKPFIADTPLAVLLKQASEPLPRPRQFVPGLPEEVEKVLFKALAKKPEDRYQDAGAFAEALERLGRGEVEGGWGKMINEAPKSRRMLWLVGGLIGLVVLAGAITLGSILLKHGVGTSPVTTATSGLVGVATMLPTPTGKLVYSENFEDGFAHEFTYNGGSWNVIDDGTGNKVLELKPEAPHDNASFGPTVFSDGVIEYRFKVINGDNPLLQFNFRMNPAIASDYLVLYNPGSLSLLYQDPVTGWGPVEASSGNGTSQFGNGEWITIRVEAFGQQIKLFAGGNLVTRDLDSRSKSGMLFFTAYPNSDILFDDIKVWETGSN